MYRYGRTPSGSTGLGLGSGTLRRHQGHIAGRHRLHFAVGNCGELSPRRVRVGSGAETASEETSQSEIGVDKAFRVGRESEEIRRGLKINGIHEVLGQPEVDIAEAGEQRRQARGRAGVCAVRSCPLGRRRRWGG